MRSVPDCPSEGCRTVHAVRCWLKEKNGRGKRGKTKIDSKGVWTRGARKE